MVLAVAHDLALGLLHVALQTVEASGQRIEGAAGGLGAGRGLLGEVGLADRVGDPGGLLRIAGLHAHLDHEGALGPAHGELGLEGVQRDVDGIAARRHRRVHAQRALDPGERRVGRVGADELVVLVEAQPVDHPAQDVVGLDHPHLALGDRDAAVGLGHAGVHVVVDDAQVAGIDEHLDAGGVARRDQAEQRHGRRDHEQGAEQDEAAPAPEPAQDHPRAGARRDLRQHHADGVTADPRREVEHPPCSLTCRIRASPIPSPRPSSRPRSASCRPGTGPPSGR